MGCEEYFHARVPEYLVLVVGRLWDDHLPADQDLLVDVYRHMHGCSMCNRRYSSFRSRTEQHLTTAERERRNANESDLGSIVSNPAGTVM